MTNENLINLINKDKPVELVQELEDYEIKTSKLSPAARAKVVKKWGGDYVSESREGYGPCVICDSGSEQWRYLYLSCPGINDRGVPCGNPDKSYWYHSTDSGQTQISNRAKIRCSECYTSDHMSWWSFKCSRHEGGKYYQTSSLQFKIAINLVNGAEPYIGTTMANDIITYLVHPDHRNEGRSGW